MFDKLDEVVARYQAINDQLMRPDLSPKDLMNLSKERSQLDPIVEKYHLFQSNISERENRHEPFHFSGFRKPRFI